MHPSSSHGVVFPLEVLCPFWLCFYACYLYCPLIDPNSWLHFSRFLTKLLTEDLPRLFVRPKKIVLDFQKGKLVGPVANDFKSGEVQEGNKDFSGELSATLVDARNLSYVFFGNNYISLCTCLEFMNL